MRAIDETHESGGIDGVGGAIRQDFVRYAGGARQSCAERVLMMVLSITR
jgi:hypothetical protein